MPPPFFNHTTAVPLKSFDILELHKWIIVIIFLNLMFYYYYYYYYYYYAY